MHEGLADLLDGKNGHMEGGGASAIPEEEDGILMQADGVLKGRHGDAPNLAYCRVRRVHISTQACA
jgi:hypothetical protein